MDHDPARPYAHAHLPWVPASQPIFFSFLILESPVRTGYFILSGAWS